MAETNRNKMLRKERESNFTAPMRSYTLTSDNPTRTDYFEIGQKGFLESKIINNKDYNLFTCMEDIATLVVISSFNVKDFTSFALYTHQITPFMIASRFGFRNLSRNYKRVLESVENLRKNKVISIVDCITGEKLKDNKKLEKHSLIKIYQDKRLSYISNIKRRKDGEEENHVFSSMRQTYFSSIVDGHQFKDNEKFYLLATYATIASRINAYKKEYNYVDDVLGPYSKFNCLLQVINYESHAKQAERAHIDRKTFGKYAKKLVDLKILNRIAVQRDNQDSKISYYYSKYYHSRQLNDFVSMCSAYFDENCVPPNYSYLKVKRIIPYQESDLTPNQLDESLEIDSNLYKVNRDGFEIISRENEKEWNKLLAEKPSFMKRFVTKDDNVNSGKIKNEEFTDAS
ncbi:hypothetical protein [Facklamia miroungae]|uniref:Uncharacterized protein n=1 Tax=Facklamia miroungae TaxID=120956 RepID=A0A1G7UGD5_9LACT|nr:hypothetical protein [Facklamia miroungae]NKZ30112.1 hypothetical protein [Facklamia miroungae]SDG46666.1 hypothetical protein SAMN05421791_1109 [Facklamia miroungae]